MIVKGNNYEFKVGLRTMRILKEKYGKDIEDMNWGVLDLVELVHCSLLAYSDFDGTVEDIEDALDDDPNSFKDVQQAVTTYFNKVTEALGEAKN